MQIPVKRENSKQEENARYPISEYYSCLVVRWISWTPQLT